MNTLTLRVTQREIEPSLASNKTTRTFLDFEVDGRPLYEFMVQNGLDNISPIWLDAPVPAEIDRAIARLLGEEPGDAPGGRVSVYVCPECGDLGCGAVTVELDIGQEHVSWRDWGYQTNYEDTSDRSEVAGLGLLTFDRKQYASVLLDARRQLTAL